MTIMWSDIFSTESKFPEALGDENTNTTYSGSLRVFNGRGCNKLISVSILQICVGMMMPVFLDAHDIKFVLLYTMQKFFENYYL